MPEFVGPRLHVEAILMDEVVVIDVAELGLEVVGEGFKAHVTSSNHLTTRSASGRPRSVLSIRAKSPRLRSFT
jgi:hypothetical protein